MKVNKQRFATVTYLDGVVGANHFICAVGIVAGDVGTFKDVFGVVGLHF